MPSLLSISFSATTSLPNNLPAKFIEPIGRPANQFWAVNNYADVDPRANSSTDYRNGLYQYDGHNARDSGPWGFSSQDQGIPIYAAADGVVDATSDGYFDRETTFGNRPANYVEIDHGNGFKTLYYHFATNTVVVKPGQVVLAGQLLAHMGSSGISTGTHLHYTPYYRNAPIEVGYAPAVYLASPLPYGGDVSKFFFETGISNNIQNNDLNDHISEINHFALNSGGLVGFWMETYNLRVGDILRWRYYSPGGTLASTNTYSIPQDYRFSIWWWNRLLTDFSTTPGTWTITMDINGTVQQSKSMLIDSTGEAAMRVTESSAGLINSGRTTPIDFGAVASGGSAVQRSFTIQNHGTTSLTLSNLRLPPGFSLVGSLPANTGVGSSSTLTISLDSTVVGAKFGSVTVDTNDGNTPQFWFNISGSVTGTPPTGRPTIAIVGPSTSLYGRSLPTIINPDATVTIPQGQSSPGFAGGQLKVEVDNAPTKNDWLSINRVYGNSGRIVDDIGTVTGGTKGRPLIVTFNNNADLASIQQLVRNIAYASLEPRYIYARKYIRFTLTDAVGLASNLAIAHIIPAAKDPFHHLYDEKSSNRNSTEITEVSRISSGPSTISTAMRSAAMESILAELETNHKSRRIVRSLRAQ